jgi:hypothetical protein
LNSTACSHTFGNAKRREWATISQEHFASAGLMTNKAAWRGIKQALEKGYIVRRKVGYSGMNMPYV